MRYKEIIINENDSNQRLDKFLEKYFQNIPKSLLYKYIRQNIKINNKRGKHYTILKKDDKLSFYHIDNKFFPNLNTKNFPFLNAPETLNIIYEDDNIIIIDKEPGLTVHSGNDKNKDNLVLRLQHYLYSKNEYNPEKENTFAPALANRIDRNTGGIILGAKNAESLRILNKLIKKRSIKRFYLCLVFGNLNNKNDVLEDHLIKDENLNQVFITDIANNNNKKKIKTKYNVLDENNEFSLLEVELITGRTHQIRVHMASIGHPIVGDIKYGTKEMNKNIAFKGQALYSYRIVFNFTENAGMLNYLKNKEFKVNNVWFAENKKIIPFV